MYLCNLVTIGATKKKNYLGSDPKFTELIGGIRSGPYYAMEFDATLVFVLYNIHRIIVFVCASAHNMPRCFFLDIQEVTPTKKVKKRIMVNTAFSL